MINYKNVNSSREVTIPSQKSGREENSVRLDESSSLCRDSCSACKGECSPNMEGIGRALRFINRVKKEPNFRSKLYNYESLDTLHAYLQEEGFHWGTTDFDDAVRKLQLEASSETAAQEIAEISNWWQFLLQTVQTQQNASC